VKGVEQRGRFGDRAGRQVAVPIAFTLALELAERAARAPDEAARSAASRIRAGGASRPVRLSAAELAALAQVIDAWSVEAETARRLRKLLR
jgi:hypothetical protein